MKKYLFLSFFFLSTSIFAQIPEDALRNSYYPQNGTARSLAIGGAMGSLGGDISAIYVNPAGLGMYRTGELAFSPSFFLNNNKIDYRETAAQNKKNSLAPGTIGAVFGWNGQRNPGISQSISFAFTQAANFNNTVQYKGFNNYSSFSEQWVEQISNSHQSLDDALNNPNFAFGAAPALYTYLVDTFRNTNNIVEIKSLPQFILDKNEALLQENTIKTKGGIYELALGYAVNKNDQLQFGVALGIPIVNYYSNTSFTESDTSADNNNSFGYFKYTDDFKTTGVGINLKLGVIYRPSDFFRLGLAIHTPTYMSGTKDKRSTSLETNTENYNGIASVSSNLFTNNRPGENQYDVVTPWKILVSGSYVLRQTDDVKKQRGFITADIEYVRHRASRFYTTTENAAEEEKTYYKELNKVVRDQYKGNFNFRVGGELKFNTIMGRLGFAYYGNPYKVDELKSNKILLSGGLGYRNKGFFIDLTYVHAINKDVNFPYRLNDKANTFAEVDNIRGNIIATVGMKF